MPAHSVRARHPTSPAPVPRLKGSSKGRLGLGSPRAGPRALNVEFIDRATEQIEAAATWWRVNRPYAPRLFADELADALALLVRSPFLAQVFAEVEGQFLETAIVEFDSGHLPPALRPERAPALVSLRTALQPASTREVDPEVLEKRMVQPANRPRDLNLRRGCSRDGSHREQPVGLRIWRTWPRSRGSRKPSGSAETRTTRVGFGHKTKRKKSKKRKGQRPKSCCDVVDSITPTMPPR